MSILAPSITTQVVLYGQKLFSASKKTSVFLGVLNKKTSSARRVVPEKQEFTFRK
jgi:hypothetical protein